MSMKDRASSHDPDGEGKLVKGLRDRVKSLEKMLELAVRQAESQRASKFRLPVGKPRSRGKSSFCRVVVPDVHGSYLDKPAVKAFFADLEQIQPSEVILLGDLLEAGGFLAEHQTLGFVSEGEYSWVDDQTAANQFLDEVQKRAPGARIEMLEGNHEGRIERWIMTQKLRHQKDVEHLRQLFGPQQALHVEKRGIGYYLRSVHYDNLPIPGTIKRGACHFTHGAVTARNAAQVMVRKFSGNVCFGHTHRPDQASARTVKDGRISAFNDGCLCVLQRLWNHTNITDWGHGYGLQAVQPDGTFLHLSVPIIDGVSYLRPLASHLGK